MNVRRTLSRATRLAAVACASLALNGCWWNGSDSTPAPAPAPAHYSVGGTVAGLSTAGLVLTNGSDTLTVPANATSFTFATTVVAGSAYSVTVTTQPSGAQCTVAQGSGSVAAANITAVAVTCVASTQTVGGTLSGLATSGLVLANGTDSVSPPANATSFVFAHAVAVGASYAVSISTQPANSQCTLTNATGTVGATAVTTVQVSCMPVTQTIGGGITGLVTAGLVLANGSDTFSPAANATSFIFAHPVPEGAAYAVTVQTQPAGATCVVSNGSGTVGASPVGTVMVTCTATTYHIGGTISGLSATGLVLANGSDTVSPASGATSYTLPTALPAGASYSVTIKTQPTGLTCTVAGAFPATLGNANVTTAAVTCGAATKLPLLAGREVCPSTAPTVIAGTGANASVGIQPLAFAYDAAGTLYFTSTRLVVEKVTAAGVVSILAGTEYVGGNLPVETDGTGPAASFSRLQGIAVDSTGSNIYVADRDEVRKITAAGVVTTLVHNVMPYGVAVNAAGVVYFTDQSTNTIQAIATDGTVTTLAGSGGQGSANGTGTSASFNFPGGLAIDTTGNLYVADTLNSQIRMVTPGGVVTRLAGGAPQFTDGTGAAAGFGQPRDLMIDAAGNLYVVDEIQTAIRKVTPAGVVTTVATTPLFNTQYGLTPPGGALLLPVNTTSVTFAVSATDQLIVPIGCALETAGP